MTYYEFLKFVGKSAEIDLLFPLQIDSSKFRFLKACFSRPKSS